jgi:hypothetical protein
MSGAAKVHRRVASQAKWSYQHKGAELLEAADTLSQYQKRCRKLIVDMEELTSEQLQLQQSGYFDAAQREGVLRLMGELRGSLVAWQDATNTQEELVRQRRHELAVAQDRKNKSEEKYQEALVDLQNIELAFEAKELEDIYINSFGRKAK